VLRKVFGAQREYAIGDRRKIHVEELYDLYSPPNIIRMIKIRRTIWVGHVARTE
jgi:hypothetical protein